MYCTFKSIFLTRRLPWICYFPSCGIASLPFQRGVKTDGHPPRRTSFLPMIISPPPPQVLLKLHHFPWGRWRKRVFPGGIVSHSVHLRVSRRLCHWLLVQMADQGQSVLALGGGGAVADQKSAKRKQNMPHM